MRFLDIVPLFINNSGIDSSICTEQLDGHFSIFKIIARNISGFNFIGIRTNYSACSGTAIVKFQLFILIIDVASVCVRPDRICRFICICICTPIICSNLDFHYLNCSKIGNNPG